MIELLPLRSHEYVDPQISSLAHEGFETAVHVLKTNNPDRVVNTQIETPNAPSMDGISMFLRGSVGSERELTSVKLIRRITVSDDMGSYDTERIVCTLDKSNTGKIRLKENYAPVTDPTKAKKHTDQIATIAHSLQETQQS